MEGKKKYFALVIFLFVTLMVFAFANPIVEDEKDFTDGGNNNQTTEQVKDKDENKTEEENQQTENQNNNQTVNNEVKDNSYENALTAVEKAEATYDKEDVDSAKELVNKVTDETKKGELEDRLEEVEAGIEVMELIKELEYKTAKSENKEDLETAKDYRDESEIADKLEKLTNETVKEKLQERLDNVSKVLDDQTAPVINIKNNEAFTKDVVIEVEDENEFDIYLSKNGSEKEEIENNTETTGEGIYELTVIDKAFNEQTIRFVVDGTDPKFKGLNNGGHYDEITIDVEDLSNVTITISKDGSDETVIENNTTVKEEGTYKVTATDEAGNTTTYWVAIDKKAPTIERTSEEEYVTIDQTVTVKDKFLTQVKVEGPEHNGTYTREDFTVGDKNENFAIEFNFTTEGTYKVTATDKKGLTTEETFTIDKTTPVINGFEKDKYYYNTSVKPELIEENLASYTLNGNEYDGSEITKDGKYTLVAVDKAGQKAEVKFVLDQTAPSVTGIEEGKFYKEVKPIITDENLAYVTVDKLPFIPGQSVKLYGTHQLVAVDKAGNKTTVNFTIDNIKPHILLLDRLEFIQGDLIPIKPVIIEQHIDKITVKLNGKEIDYKQGDQLTEHGLYEITVTDKAGNTDTATFTMDNNEPLLLEPINGGVYKDVKITMIDENMEPSNIVLLKQTKTVGDKLGISLPIYEKVEYTYGDTITEEGSYIVVVADKAYNVSYAKFTIDRTAPTSNIEAGKYYQEVTPEVKDANLALVTLSKKQSLVIIDTYVPVLTYKHGDTITEDGEYKLTALDLAGNSYEVEFVIDGTKPTIEGIVEGAHYNKVTPTITDTNIASITLNGNTYVSGTEINEDGEYTIVATDKAGNSTTVNFVIDKDAIKITYPTNNKYNETITPVIDSKEEITSITLNGENYVEGTAIEAEGTYTLIVTDKYTNTAEVTFTIDKTEPVIEVELIDEIGANKTETTLDVIAKVTDDTDDDKYIEPAITHSAKEGTLDKVIISTDYLGIYTLTYNTTDEAGNAAEPVTKTISVYKADYVIVFEEEINRTTTYNKNAVTPKAELHDDNGKVEDITDFTITKDGVKVDEIKDAGVYTVTANTTKKNGEKDVVATATYTINKAEVSLTYTHYNTNLSNQFEYEYDGNNNPYKATLSDGTELTITYKNLNDETATVLNAGTYTMSVEVNTNNYILTNETTQAFEVKEANLTITFPTTIVVGDTQKSLKEKLVYTNGNGIVLNNVDAIVSLNKKGRFLYVPTSSVDGAGEYNITVTTENKNYTLVGKDWKFTVTSPTYNVK